MSWGLRASSAGKTAAFTKPATRWRSARFVFVFVVAWLAVGPFVPFRVTAGTERHGERIALIV
jgi:hypothetical protein